MNKTPTALQRSGWNPVRYHTDFPMRRKGRRPVSNQPASDTAKHPPQRANSLRCRKLLTKHCCKNCVGRLRRAGEEPFRAGEIKRRERAFYATLLSTEYILSCSSRSCPPRAAAALAMKAPIKRERKENSASDEATLRAASAPCLTFSAAAFA